MSSAVKIIGGYSPDERKNKSEILSKIPSPFSADCSISLQSPMTQHIAGFTYFFFRCYVFCFVWLLPYPFDSLQVSFQQAVQRKSDDVVHVLELEEGWGERREFKGYTRGFNTAGQRASQLPWHLWRIILLVSCDVVWVCEQTEQTLSFTCPNRFSHHLSKNMTKWDK